MSIRTYEVSVKITVEAKNSIDAVKAAIVAIKNGGSKALVKVKEL